MTNTQNQIAAMSGLIASPTPPSSSKDAVIIAMLPLQESEGHKNEEIIVGTVAESQVLDAENQVDVVYPSGVRLTLIVSCLASSVFLVALVHDQYPTRPIPASKFLTSAQDETIIATAIPTITNQFDSLDDVGWYGSA